MDVDARSLAEKERLSLEDAARRLRYEALETCRQEAGAEAIFLAHHQDDQAETVLLRLLRGTSLTGLCGIRTYSDIGLHPLLELRHRELAHYCQLMGVQYCHDSSNDDVNIARNRVRHELVPYLEQHFNSNIKETLARMAQQLLAEDEHLEKQAFDAFVEAAVEPKATSASMLGALCHKLLKPLIKNFWLITMMIAVSSSWVSPMATWLSL